MTEQPNNIIFTLLFNYLNRLHDNQYFAEEFYELYEHATKNQQHVMLDMIAHSHVQKNINTPKAIPWEEHSAAPNTTHPALTVVMRALKHSVPLEDADGYQTKLFDPETLDTLKTEVLNHHTWKQGNPYFENMRFISNITDETTTVKPPVVSTDNKFDFIKFMSLMMVSPTRMAPLIMLYYFSLYRRPQNYAISAYEGALEFEHQSAIVSHPYSRSWSKEAIALAHCPDELVSQWLHKGYGALTGDDYRLWADTMESLFPARELAYNLVSTPGTENNYRNVLFWEFKLATSKITQIFEINENLDSNRLDLAATVWVLHKMRDTEGWGMNIEPQGNVF